MNEMSLSRLYRRLVSARPQPDMDAAQLVSAMARTDELTVAQREAVAADLAASPQHADLARLLGELQPESVALAEGVGKLCRHAAHPVRTREMRTAVGARRREAHPLRWAGGLAACLAVAFGVLSWHGGHRDWNEVAASARSVPMADRIFTSQDRIFVAVDDARPATGAARGDELFRANFAIGG